MFIRMVGLTVKTHKATKMFINIGKVSYGISTQRIFSLSKKKKKPSNEYANMYLELLLSKTASHIIYIVQSWSS